VSLGFASSAVVDNLTVLASLPSRHTWQAARRPRRRYSLAYRVLASGSAASLSSCDAFEKSERR